ncbi:hypothetical protein [Altererythrobacter sp. MF3-039]
MSQIATNLTAAFIAVFIAAATIVPVVNVPAADYSTITLTPELA